MTDKELINELRSIADKRRKGNRFDSLEYAAAERIEELEAKLKTSEEIGRAFEEDAGQLRARLARAIAALDEALYFLDPDEEDIAKGAGLYRIVTTHRELKEN